jgi:hypothetical protein
MPLLLLFEYPILQLIAYKGSVQRRLSAVNHYYCTLRQPCIVNGTDGVQRAGRSVAEV